MGLLVFEKTWLWILLNIVLEWTSLLRVFFLVFLEMFWFAVVALLVHLKWTSPSERLEHWDQNVATFALDLHSWNAGSMLAAPPF